MPDGSGHDPENPTLAEMSDAAFTLLVRKTRRLATHRNGFVLVIEGGSIDWAGHDNRLAPMIGELRAFDAAVAKIIARIEDPTDDVDWENTSLIVLGDHETGLLSAELGAFPDKALGEVSDRTLALKKQVLGLGTRASWEDTDQDGIPDTGERV